MYICIYINMYIYRRANGIYIQKSCSIWTVCPCLNTNEKSTQISNLINDRFVAGMDQDELIDELEEYLNDIGK